MATSSSVPVSTGTLTLKYSGAAISALIATLGVLSLFSELFGLWTGSGGIVTLLGGYTSIVTTAVATALFSVLAFLLYRAVTKEVALQPGYIERPAYLFITNSFCAVVGGLFVFVIAQLVSILISSLLLIGTSTDIGALYLTQFLPGLLTAAVIGFVGFSAYKIVTGKNFSSIMTIVLMSLAGALLVAVLITVPIKAHSTAASSSSSSTNDYNDYFEELYNLGN